MILRTNPFHQDPAPGSPTHPLLKLAGSPSFDPGTVSYLQGDGNYTVVHFIDGRTLLTAITQFAPRPQIVCHCAPGG